MNDTALAYALYSASVQYSAARKSASTIALERAAEALKKTATEYAGKLNYELLAKLAEFDNYKTSFLNQRDTIARMHAEADTLRVRAVQYKSDRDDIAARCERQGGTIQDLLLRRDALTIERDDARKSYSGQCKAITTLEANIKTLESRHANHLQTIEVLQAECHKLTGERDASKPPTLYDWANTRAERDHLRAERDNLIIERDDLKEANRILKGTVATMKISIDQQAAIICASKQTTFNPERTTASEVAFLREDLRNVRAQRDKLLHERDCLRSNLDNTKRHCEDLTTHLTAARANLVESNRRCDALRHDRDTANASCMALTGRATAAESKVGSAVNRANQWKDIAQAKEAKLIIAEASQAKPGELAYLNITLDETRRTAAFLRQELQEANRRSAGYQRGLGQVVAKLKTTEEKVKQLQYFLSPPLPAKTTTEECCSAKQVSNISPTFTSKNYSA